MRKAGDNFINFFHRPYQLTATFGKIQEKVVKVIHYLLRLRPDGPISHEKQAKELKNNACDHRPADKLHHFARGDAGLAVVFNHLVLLMHCVKPLADSETRFTAKNIGRKSCKFFLMTAVDRGVLEKRASHDERGYRRQYEETSWGQQDQGVLFCHSLLIKNQPGAATFCS
jgi:hypothetical protein